MTGDAFSEFDVDISDVIGADNGASGIARLVDGLVAGPAEVSAEEMLAACSGAGIADDLVEVAMR